VRDLGDSALASENVRPDFGAGVTHSAD
jgi:hypothetical protein